MGGVIVTLEIEGGILEALKTSRGDKE